VEIIAINAGSCAWVGLAGHAVGGGYGFLARSYGLLSGNILEMKAVNAQGINIF
jgi:FAD/FMN-containing dehydrogenase